MSSTLSRVSGQFSRQIINSANRRLWTTAQGRYASVQHATNACRRVGDLKVHSDGAQRSGYATSTGKRGGSGSGSGSEGITIEEVDRDSDLDSDLDLENALEGKETRENLHTGLRSRAVDAIRYEYLAQRADVEAETDAAMLFRGLSEASKQQAMGFVELLEEYGDIQMSSTMDNVDIASDTESDVSHKLFKSAANVAADEDLGQVEEWFDDLADASQRAANKLEQLHQVMEDELLSSGMEDEDGEHGVIDGEMSSLADGAHGKSR